MPGVTGDERGVNSSRLGGTEKQVYRLSDQIRTGAAARSGTLIQRCDPDIVEPKRDPTQRHRHTIARGEGMTRRCERR
jgi:hypothetical protein